MAATPNSERGFLSWLRTVRGTRRLWQALLVLVDAAVLVLATVVTYLARFEGDIPYTYGRYLLPVLAVSLVLYLVCAALFGLYRVVLRYVGIDTLLRVAGAVACAAAVLTVIDLVLGAFRQGLRYIPLGVVLIQALCAFLALSGVRVTVRAIRHLRASGQHNGVRTLIIGAGSAGSLLLRDLQSHPGSMGFDTVGFLDDNTNLRGALFAGLPVLGTTADMAEVVAAQDIGQVFVALPSADPDFVRGLLNRATDLGVATRIMPRIVIERGQVRVGDLRKVDVRDLLGRELTPIDVAGIRETIQGRRVVVTGAAGSIGSELCRQLVAMEPECIHLFEIDESRLYELWFELDAMRAGVARMHVVDIRDMQKLRGLLSAIRPAVVLHAAAYKQVPLMEIEPIEAIRSNVLGTANVLQAADAAGAERFVLISTDKAVAPLNVMGKTKELAERLVLAYAQGRDARMCCVTVRFGNVLGSRGSVVPIFEEKLARNEPLTVTDPDVTRYFMLIPEAARLVLQAQAIGSCGDIFLLEMGEPVRIVDLARKMIALSGAPVDIEFTGLRPGEKLHEALVADDETLEPTERENILRVRDLHEAPLTAEQYEQLVAAVAAGRIEHEQLMEL
ncbi:MAG: polysaccharide biosynthesis protein [Actinomycetes bacterium]|nr:polysaccharide biosynthesis protein [Actinomycetes bacterium]